MALCTQRARTQLFASVLYCAVLLFSLYPVNERADWSLQGVFFVAAKFKVGFRSSAVPGKGGR